MALTAQQQSIVSQTSPSVAVVTTPMTLTPIQQLLVNDSVNPELMAEAIAEGVFYAEVIEDMSGSMNPGTVGDGDVVMPALFATLAEAQFENQGNIAEIERQKTDPNFDRDADDHWEGVVVKVFWDGGDELTFVDIESGENLGTENWREACGL